MISVGTIVLIALIVVIVIFVIVVLARAIRIVPQATAGIVERLGRYHKTLAPGLNILVPFIDRLRPLIDMREQVVSFPPQPVITEDNLVVSIDTVVYFQVTDARAATYEIANYLGAVEQLTTTTLRNVVGGLNLEEALTSRDNINGQLRIVLDEATGKWGIRVGRVELKAIEPPTSIQDAMEQQLRAERSRRAAILQAEGTKQSQILEAEGQRQAAILQAEGAAKAQVLRAQGEAQAIATVFEAIHTGDPDDKLLSYQYLQTLPKLAEGSANKIWMIPSEFTEALSGIARGFVGGAGRVSTPSMPDSDSGGSAEHASRPVRHSAGSSTSAPGDDPSGNPLDLISRLASASLATAPSGGIDTDVPSDASLDERLAASDRSVSDHIAAANLDTDAGHESTGDADASGAPATDR
ncbi:SPFH domain-containing protein [Curtobacterium ammoniigenes]|uniref:SPFH domain-containing protein n=1 Tax=Curtobacterium ammoniigenes TaxID=395387 RepID=UPI0009FAC545|nr:SPFH domain-containing protein [Curtobacterium ammoniigenes]